MLNSGSRDAVGWRSTHTRTSWAVDAGDFYAAQTTTPWSVRINQVAHSYAEWAPTKEGIETWFQAASQLAYLFKVKAVGQEREPQGVTVEIQAQQLLPGTRLHIKYAAIYPGAFAEGNQPRGSLWVVGLEGKPSLVDYSHFFKVEAGAVTLKDSTITLKLYPRIDVPLVNGFRVVLETLTLELRLDVHGDGDPLQGGEDATLIVPTTKEGKKWVKFVYRRGEDLGEFKSFDLTDLQV